MTTPDSTLTTFESRIRGDKNVDPYTLYREINAGIAHRDPRYMGRPLAWSTSMLDRWYKDLTCGTSANAGSLYDLLQKASILMETDLRFYEGMNQTAFKTRLFTSLRPLLYNIAALNEKTRAALTTFLHSSRPYIPHNLYAACMSAVAQPHPTVA